MVSHLWGEQPWDNGKLEFKCTSIRPRPGFIFHHCLLQTTGPLQSNYQAAYKAPFLQIDFPGFAFPPSENQFSSDAFADTKACRGTETEETPGAVWCSLFTTPVLATLNQEETSAKLMNKLWKDSPAYAWWRW